MAPGGRAGYPRQPVSHHPRISSYPCLHSAQIILLLSYLSTLHLHTVVPPSMGGPLSSQGGGPLDVLSLPTKIHHFQRYHYMYFFVFAHAFVAVSPCHSERVRVSSLLPPRWSSSSGLVVSPFTGQLEHSSLIPERENRCLERPGMTCPELVR